MKVLGVKMTKLTNSRGGCVRGWDRLVAHAVPWAAPCACLRPPPARPCSCCLLLLPCPPPGFIVEMSAATIVILGSRFGLPLSTTHTLVGAVTGVGLLESRRGGFNGMLLVRFFAGAWVCMGGRLAVLCPTGGSAAWMAPPASACPAPRACLPPPSCTPHAHPPLPAGLLSLPCSRLGGHSCGCRHHLCCLHRPGHLRPQP